MCDRTTKMTFKRCAVAVFVVLLGLSSAEDGKDPDRNSVDDDFFDGRGFGEIIRCAGQLDTACVLDRAEDVLRESHQRFLVEADKTALASARKQGEDESPSALIESISNIFSEISELFFKGGFTGMFRDAKEDDSDDAAELEEDDKKEDDKKSADKKDDDEGRNDNGVARGKKKKKIKAVIKLLILGIVLFGKITLLLKILAAHLQIKFLLIAAAGLLINAARFYLELKKGHQPQKVIYYEHAQHQHHYDGAEEDWSSGGGGSSHGGGYWARSYEDADKEATAQDIAYAKQKPTVSSFSWV